MTYFINRYAVIYKVQEKFIFFPLSCVYNIGITKARNYNFIVIKKENYKEKLK